MNHIFDFTHIFVDLHTDRETVNDLTDGLASVIPNELHSKLIDYTRHRLEIEAHKALNDFLMMSMLTGELVRTPDHKMDEMIGVKLTGAIEELMV